VDASRFAGTTNLTAGGPGKVVLFGGGSAGKGGSSLTLNNTATGNDVLIGGPGANTLVDNGTGFDMLIGGGGKGFGGPNSITGNGKDILISGYTVYDDPTRTANLAALDSILAEWSSSDSYAVKINKLNAAGGLLDPATKVFWNAADNTISDGAQPNQMNWFLYNFSSDHATLRVGVETGTNITKQP
jgi:hypothetical protein